MPGSGLQDASRAMRSWLEALIRSAIRKGPAFSPPLRAVASARADGKQQGWAGRLVNWNGVVRVGARVVNGGGL